LNTPSALTLVRLGRYQVVSRIATGGMAEVYLAVHGELSGFRTPVVVKKVLPHLACNPQFIDMFLDEARIASLLDHPNVVRIYEVGKNQNEYFLAMELVQGKPFSALLRRCFERHHLIDPRLAAFVVAQAAAGLNHAHGLTDPLGNPLGLVHRDVSPQNILISFEGSVKVIDFGIARALGRITDTSNGGRKGKFGYMSPEQARGEDVDLRTDIFALGVVLWEALCGRRLFQRENDLATMRALIYDPIPKPSSVVPIDPDLEGIVLRALARNPSQRFQSGRELASALERFVVVAGGASTTDLGALMKGLFAEDLATWQQTLRTALNTPALPEDNQAAGAPTALARSGGRRWSLLLLGGAAALAGGWFWLKRSTGLVPPGGAGPAVSAPAVTAPTPPPPASAAPATPNPPAAASTEGPAPAVAPSAPSPTPPAAAPEEESSSSRRRERRRHRHGSSSSSEAPAAPPPGPDRRPNPF
jgi:serine/threonine-protein kinase